MSALMANEASELSILALLGFRELEHKPPALDRSVARRIALQVLFEIDCTSHRASQVINDRIAAQAATRGQERYVRRLVTQVQQNLSFLDEKIRLYVIDWQLEQLAIVDRNILRMAILELAVTRIAPVAVIVNEAIELARLFSGEDSFNFIHGILGAIAEENMDADNRVPDDEERAESPGNGYAPDPEPEPREYAVSRQAISRIIQSIALSGSALLAGESDFQELPGSGLPGQVGRLPFDAEHKILTTVHEWHVERASGLFPEATHLVLARGKAISLLERVANEFLPDGSIPLDEHRRARWHNACIELENQGDRVLAIAWQPLQHFPEEKPQANPDGKRDVLNTPPAGPDMVTA